MLYNSVNTQVGYFFREVENNKRLAGQLAGKKEFFGKHNRFAIAPVHTRFDKVDWFCWDAEKLSEDLPESYASIIGQKDSYKEAYEFIFEQMYNN